MKSKDSNGSEVAIGDSIKILEIDKRITDFLPADEKEQLNEFIGKTLEVTKINSDGTMVVTKTWSYPETGEVVGHDVAIFPQGSLLVSNT